MNIKSRIIILHVLFFLILPLGARAKTQTPIEIPPLPSPSFKRIVSLKPNITMILMDLGLKDEIIGITKFCPKPTPGSQVVGDYNSVDIEGVIRLNPDLVLMSPENTKSRDYDALVNAKLNVKIFDFKTYIAMKTSLLSIAELLNLKEKGEAIVQDIESKLTELKQKILTQNQANKLFIAIVQKQPLMVASGNTYFSTLLKEAGFENAFAANQIPYPVIDEEELIREFVAYTFNLSHKDALDTETEFFNKQLININLDDFNANPQSVDNLVKLVNNLPPPQPQP